MDKEKLAVTVRGAYKTYDTKNFVLKGLNMNVREGSIYGLLGSSGCGKSTLLNSIVGLVGLDNGTILLSVKSKRDVGFMPQSVCLYEQLTIEELLHYFATMYGMSNTKSQTRMDLMFDMLDLPDKRKCIPELSGGQKRRVSLAIALIHDPELLMLDEPTVGLDPMLRHRIWEFLINWCEDGRKTVIITTHYIEETKQAHTVGLMREGIMLCEKSPQAIMGNYNTQSLEDAFLKLCLQQSYEEAAIRPVRSKKLTFSPITLNNESFTRSRFAAEMKKNLIYLWRNLSVTFFIFGLPSVCILLFYFAYGREPENISLAVVNDDTLLCGNYSYQPNVCDMSNLSCNYLYHLTEKTISLVNYKEVATAIDHIKNTDIWGVLHFSSNFSSALSVRLNDPLISNDEVVDNSIVAVYMDSSDKMVNELLHRKLHVSYFEFSKELYHACGYPDELADLPIKFENPIYGSLKQGFLEFSAPAVISILMFGMPLICSSVVIEEKNSGAISRSIVAGTSLLEVLTAHVIVQIGLQVLQLVSSMIMMYWILKFPLDKPFLCMALLLLQGLAGTAVAFSISTSLSHVVAVACLNTGGVLIIFIIGGAIWPVEGIHSSIRLLSWIVPNTLTTLSLRNLTTKGWDFTNKNVYLGFICSSSWIIVFTVITCIYIKRNKTTPFLSKKVR